MTTYADWLYTDVHARFLASALAARVRRDGAGALPALHALGLFPDAVEGDVCFAVASGVKTVSLDEWLASPGAPEGRLSARIADVRRTAENPFRFTMAAFAKKALPHYDGVPHAWPHYEGVRAGFARWPAEKQTDFIHTYLEFFDSNPPTTAAEKEAVAWVRAQRRRRYFFVLEPRAAKSRAAAWSDADAADGLKRLREAAAAVFDFCARRLPASRDAVRREAAERAPHLDKARTDETARRVYDYLEAVGRFRFLDGGVPRDATAIDDSVDSALRALADLAAAVDGAGRAGDFSRLMTALGAPREAAAAADLAEGAARLRETWLSPAGRAARPALGEALARELGAKIKALARAGEDYLARAW